MRKSALPRQVGWAASLLVLVSVAMLVALQVYSARDVDRDARVRAEWIVSHNLVDYAKSLAALATPQTYWDEAVANLDNRYNPYWAGEYVGSYFWETSGFERAVVVDGNDQIVFASAKGAAMPSARRTEMVEKAEALLRQVRSAERARGPLPAPPIPDEMRIDSIQRMGAFTLDGEPVFLSATLIQPDKFTRLKGRSAPVVLLAKTIDQGVVNDISSRMMLNEARLIPAAMDPRPGFASVQLRDPSGKVVASLEWNPPRPGSDLLDKVAPALALFAIGLAVIVWLTLRKGRRMAQSLVESEAAAYRLAFHDRLSDLPNRVSLDRELAERIQAMALRGKCFALHCIDLDLFKSVNDSFGHQAGDELIRQIGERLQSLCGKDDFLARFGGDEFMLIQSGARRGRASVLARKIVSTVNEPVQLVAGRAIVGASVGIALADDPAIDAEEYVRRADLALYAAKDRGRGTATFFEPSMDSSLRNRQLVTTQLHDALVNKSIDVFYQPQVDRQGRIVGVEALARWHSDELGQVPADRFIRIAEESGLIDTLGLFTMRRAFVDSRRWPDLRVAINVSAMQLRQRDFIRRVESLIDEENIDPAQFEFEITEGVLIGDDGHTIETLSSLRDLGFNIALDDFGTGYSSLSYLQRYPIDKVKIDRTFVARLGVEREAEAVVVAIIRLARALGLDVVAEGVETEAQRMCLIGAGCEVMQGYLTGRPVPADHILSGEPDEGVTTIHRA